MPNSGKTPANLGARPKTPQGSGKSAKSDKSGPKHPKKTSKAKATEAPSTSSPGNRTPFGFAPNKEEKERQRKLLRDNARFFKTEKSRIQRRAEVHERTVNGAQVLTQDFGALIGANETLAILEVSN